MTLLTKTRAYPLHKNDPPMVSLTFPTQEEHKETTLDTQKALTDTIELALTKAGKTIHDLSAIGIRVVHSGGRFTGPTRINETVLWYLEETKSLAPLHNPPAVEAIHMLWKVYPGVPLIAVFDTTFHETMPSKAKNYALPRTIIEEYNIKRYGFHGLAHASMLRSYCAKIHIPPEQATIITMQLGSGCSMCAIEHGASVDTTMGFSPLEGLISRTRTGDIDASVVSFLSKVLGKDSNTIIEFLNRESGLKGLAGLEGDMQDILNKAKTGDKEASDTIDMYTYRIQKYLGAFDAILGRADAVVLGGGIIEHCPEIWQKIFALPAFGVVLKKSEQFALRSPITQISANESALPVFVAFVDEEQEIALATMDELTNHTI